MWFNRLDGDGVSTFVQGDSSSDDSAPQALPGFVGRGGTKLGHSRKFARVERRQTWAFVRRVAAFGLVDRLIIPGSWVRSPPVPRNLAGMGVARLEPGAVGGAALDPQRRTDRADT